MKGIAVIALVAIMGAHMGGAQKMYEDMSKLLVDEFNYYNKDVIPKHKTDSHVTVKVYPMIKRIEHMDEDLQELSTTISLTMRWTDDRLAWDTRIYNDVREIHVPASKIWVPDISVTNSVYSADEHDHPATISYNGQVEMVRVLHARTPCEMDYSAFPNDIHSCMINITSWKYAGRYLVMEKWSNVSVVYVESDSTGWEVNGNVRAKLQTIQFACCPDDDFPQFTISLTVKRDSNMLRYMFIIPIVFVSLLVPVQFLVPNQQENRQTFGVLLVIAGLLSFVNMCLHLPVTSNLPYIGTIHIVCISFATLAVLISTIVTNVGYKYSSCRPLFKCISSKVCAKNRQKKSDSYSHNDSMELENHLNSLSNGDSNKDVENLLKEIKDILSENGKSSNFTNRCDVLCFLLFMLCCVIAIVVLFSCI